jgi:hypothetical protein
VEKLCLLPATGRRLKWRTWWPFAPGTRRRKAFALGDALGDRDLPRLLKRLDEELWETKFDKDKSEIGLLYGLIGKVRAMLLLKEMLREGWIRSERITTASRPNWRSSRRQTSRGQEIQSVANESVCALQSPATG